MTQLTTPAPPPGTLVSGHFCKSRSYAVHRPAGTKDWLLLYTVSGAGEVRSGGHTQLCSPGDLVLLPPGLAHHYATASPAMSDNEMYWELQWAHFLPRPDWSYWLELPRFGQGVLYFSSAETVLHQRIQAAFSQLLAAALAPSLPLREELSLNALEHILLLVCSQHRKAAPSSFDPRVQLIVELLKVNYAETYTLEQLAAKVYLSPSRLSHLFKAQTGDSIVETHLKLRLRQAARLLELTSRQVYEIAADVGFQSPDYFSRKFSRHFGLSPVAYRKKHQI